MGQNLIDTEFALRISSSTCCAAGFYCHIFDHHILCMTCHATERPNDYYEYIARHYVHLGPSLTVNQCQVCDEIVTRTGPALDCAICAIAVHNYLKRTREAGEIPQDNALISITRIREVINPEQ